MHPAGSQTLVLVVDDEPAMRKILSEYLRRAGYDVVAAGDGREALRLFDQPPHPIGLVISDIEMPFVSGAELASSVRSSGSACPVLLISARSLPPEAEGRGWEFLAKPFTREVFLRTVDRLLAVRSQPGGPALPRLIVVDDDGAVRLRLCSLLTKDYDVVAALEEGGAVLEKAVELQPEVVLLDITMPGMNGFAVARVLRRSMPGLPILFVTQHSDPVYVAEAFACGGSGYVLKRNVVTELGPALQQVLSGGRYLSPGLRTA